MNGSETMQQQTSSTLLPIKTVPDAPGDAVPPSPQELRRKIEAIEAFVRWRG